MDYEALSELLFPDITKTPSDLEEKYPPRQLTENARVTRFAPSPTGYLHIGGLFGALTDVMTAKATGGVAYLRIEDTDKKREIEDGVSAIINGFDAFGVGFDEGVTGFGTEKGDYGPYTQSKRVEIYKTVAKDLVKKGLAYPCFCTAEELTEMRQNQEKEGTAIWGYFGKWAKCRDLTFDEIKSKIDAGQPYVLRFRANGREDGKIIFDDIIRGKIEMPENIMDVVLLKTDGIPTYHFAHAVDDHLMRTTHVIRGDEWIASVPLHIQLFKCCGFKVPKYAHIAPIMKEENGGKRKLSKRKDPEAAVTYYSQEGYPKESVIEYLLTLANSNFEDWRKTNKTAPQSAFPFNLKKMSASGALFDLAKLNDVSKNVISVMSAEEVYNLVTDWAKEYNEKLYALLTRDPEFSTKLFSIDRGTAKPRKDIAKWSEIESYCEYFFDELYTADYTMPENVSNEEAAAILKKYLEVYSHSQDKDGWFDTVKSICEPLGYTPNVKEYKKNPEAYKGHVGDVSSVIRIVVTSRRNTPDLYAIMQLLGEEKVRERMLPIKF